VGGESEAELVVGGTLSEVRFSIGRDCAGYRAPVEIYGWQSAGE